MSRQGLAPIAAITAILGIIIIGVGIYIQSTRLAPPEENIACPADAKLCPDGTTLSRTGPDCEFSACAYNPTSTESSSLETDSYLACGCGCCSGAEPVTECLYRAEGDDLNVIRKNDQELAKSPSCTTMGCSLGTLYTYCDESDLSGSTVE